VQCGAGIAWAVALAGVDAVAGPADGLGLAVPPEQPVSANSAAVMITMIRPSNRIGVSGRWTIPDPSFDISPWSLRLLSDDYIEVEGGR